MSEEAVCFLMQQNSETIRFLIEQKITYINSTINACMLWWVSSVVFYGSVLAAIWLKQHELKVKEQRFILDLLGSALSVLFLATAAFGVLIFWYSFYIQKDIDNLVGSLGGPADFFHTELSGFRWAIGFGICSFLLVTLIWIRFWCHLRRIRFKTLIVWTYKNIKGKFKTLILKGR